MSPEKLGQRIKQARKAKGLTQSQLAAACDVSQPTVHDWESGKPPTYSNLQRLAGALGTTSAWLLMDGTEAAAS